MPATTPTKKNGTTVADAYATPQETWQFVTIPDENSLGEVHANITLNKLTFEAGTTYKMPPEVATTIKDRLRVYAKSCIRVLSPKRDMVAENAVAVGSASARSIGAQPADASQITA